MAIKTKTELKTYNDSNISSNGIQSITGDIVNIFNNDIIDTFATELELTGMTENVSENYIPMGSSGTSLTDSIIYQSGNTINIDGNVNITEKYKINDKNVISSNQLHNYFFGNSGNDTMTGAPNLSLGLNALYSNTSGYANIAIGEESLYKNTTGTYNIGLGEYSLQENISGDNNVGLGTNSLKFNTTGSNNVSLGSNSLNYNTTGLNNVSIGFKSLWNNISGSNNISIGYNALYGNRYNDKNTAIGYEAGYLDNDGNINDGSNSIYLGSNTKALSTNQTNQIVIGSETIGNGSNTATLGNDNIQETYLKGNVSINNTDPKSSLDIKGSVSFNKNSIFSGNTWVDISSNLTLPQLSETIGRMYYINNSCNNQTCYVYTITGYGTETIVLNDAVASNTTNLVAGFYICYNAIDKWIVVTLKEY